MKKIEGVTSVESDMNAHTITVAFDDANLKLDRIIGALGEAGYTVPKFQQLAN